MILHGRMALTDNQRRPYAIRGVVESYGIRQTGIWPFRTCIPVIRVRISEEQKRAFNDICSGQLLVGEYGHVGGISSPLDLGVSDVQKFPIGATVGITFGYANLTQQFFFRAEPLIVVNLRALSLGDILENEIAA